MCISCTWDICVQLSNYMSDTSRSRVCFQTSKLPSAVCIQGTPYYESAALKVLFNILPGLDSGDVAGLMMLELSAAFGGVDHVTLLETLLQKLKILSDSLPTSVVERNVSTVVEKSLRKPERTQAHFHSAQSSLARSPVQLVCYINWVDALLNLQLV